MGIDDRLPSQDCRAFRLRNLSIVNNFYILLFYNTFL
ncbi:hypothetical protein MG5_02464 [Candida albicans P57072]|nr:hypothetical protein MG5_02464 [Candida albicans P57072]